MKDSITNNRVSKILGPLVWLFIWELIARYLNNTLIVPSPIETIKKLAELISSAKFFLTVGYTLLRVLMGFMLSAVIGIVLGFVCGLHEWLYNVFHPLVVTIRSTPVISIIIIALVWYQSNEVPIFICFLMCFPIMWTNVVQGVKSTDHKLLEMAKCFEMPQSRVWRHIYLPSAYPYAVAGLMTSLGLGWKVTVAAEVLSNPHYGIGAQLHRSKIYLETVELFAWTMVVVLLSFVIEYLLKYLIGKLVKEPIMR